MQRRHRTSPECPVVLKMDELTQKAPAYRPKRRDKIQRQKVEKLYTDWLTNIKDWCISRQIWRGHKIPLDGVDDVLDTWFFIGALVVCDIGLAPIKFQRFERILSDAKFFPPLEILLIFG